MCTLEKMLFKLVSLNTLLFKYGASSHPVLPTEQLCGLFIIQGYWNPPTFNI